MTEPDDADRIAARVLTVPGVAGLHGGRFGEVATYLPGRRVLGVALTEATCAIHLVVAYPNNVCDVAHAVRVAITTLVSVPVTITVEDVAAPSADGPNLERTAR